MTWHAFYGLVHHESTIALWLERLIRYNLLVRDNSTQALSGSFSNRLILFLSVWPFHSFRKEKDNALVENKKKNNIFFFREKKRVYRQVGVGVFELVFYLTTKTDERTSACSANLRCRIPDSLAIRDKKRELVQKFNK